MTNVTVFSEPLIEKYGTGHAPDAERPETPCSGDGLNMAAAIVAGTKRLAEYQKQTGGKVYADPASHKVSILCGLGTDERGDMIDSFMKQKNISTDNVVRVEGTTSAYTIHLVPKQGGGMERKVDYENRGPDSPMAQFMEQSRTQIKLDDVAKNTDVLVITGIGASRARSEKAFQKLLDTAIAVKRGGGKVVVDFNHRVNASGSPRLWVHDDNTPRDSAHVRERMDKLYALADVAVIAHDEIWSDYGTLYHPPLGHKQDALDPDPIVRHLRELKAPEGLEAPRHIIFKRGGDGGTLFYQNSDGKDTIVKTAGRKITYVDRNGGGDAMLGGTVAGLLSGYSLDQSMAIGQEMAAGCLQHLGGVIQDKFLPTNDLLNDAIPKTAQTPERWGQRAPSQLMVHESRSDVAYEPTGLQICDALHTVVNNLSDSPITHQPDSTGWWEAFSHGLSLPLRGNFSTSGREQDKGFFDRCDSAAKFLELEADFLRFDDHGFERRFNGDPKGKPIELGSDERLKSLALRVVAFVQTRKALADQGFALPPNPDLEAAVIAVKAELARNTRAQAQFNQLMGEDRPALLLRTTESKDEGRVPGKA